MRWWLSFANNDGCLGVVIAEAEEILEAVRECSNRGCNPGGQVISVPLDNLPSDAPAEVREWLEQAPTFKLLQPDELPQLLRPMKLGDAEDQGLKLPDSSETIHEECNEKPQ